MAKHSGLFSRSVSDEERSCIILTQSVNFIRKFHRYSCGRISQACLPLLSFNNCQISKNKAGNCLAVAPFGDLWG